MCNRLVSLRLEPVKLHRRAQSVPLRASGFSPGRLPATFHVCVTRQSQPLDSTYRKAARPITVFSTTLREETHKEINWNAHCYTVPHVDAPATTGNSQRVKLAATISLVFLATKVAVESSPDIWDSAPSQWVAKLLIRQLFTSRIFRESSPASVAIVYHVARASDSSFNMNQPYDNCGSRGVM